MRHFFLPFGIRYLNAQNPSPLAKNPKSVAFRHTDDPGSAGVPSLRSELALSPANGAGSARSSLSIDDWKTGTPTLILAWVRVPSRVPLDNCRTPPNARTEGPRRGVWQLAAALGFRSLLRRFSCVTRRQYLLDARFGVILEGYRLVLERVAAALEDPIWNVWLGRKNCIPAEPVYRGLFETQGQAQRALINNGSIEESTALSERERFAEGTDSISDQPVSFGAGTTSGPDRRRFAVRRIKVVPGSPP
jgi:CRISPR-associated protein (Cas_Cas5)